MLGQSCFFGTFKRLPPMDTESTDKRYDNYWIFATWFESISFCYRFLSVSSVVISFYYLP